MRRMSTAIEPSTSFPLGATILSHDVNFNVLSKSSTGVDLLLFNEVNDAQPARVLALDPGKHRTAHYWHASVPDLQLPRAPGLRDLCGGLWSGLGQTQAHDAGVFS